MGSAAAYHLTSDQHFVVSEHPDHPQVVVAAGFSGHGYKFCSVIGEVLADLTTEGRPPPPNGVLLPRPSRGRRRAKLAAGVPLRRQKALG